MTFVTRTIQTAAVIITAAAPLSAQTFAVPKPGRYGLGIEAMRPQFTSSSDLSGATALLTGHAQVTRSMRLLIELPFVFSAGNDVGAASSQAFGDPYLGIQLQDAGAQLDVGGRFPLASDRSAVLVGLATDLERFEAFLPDVATLSGIARLGSTGGTGLNLSGFAGSTYLIDANDPRGGNNELLMIYGLESIYSAAAVRAGARLSGRWSVEDDFDQAVHQAALYADLGRGRVRPTLQFRVPLDSETRQAIKWSGGVGVEIVIDP